MKLDRGYCNDLGSHLERVIAGNRSAQAQHAALNHNYRFAPDDYQHTEIPYGFSAQSPVLIRRLCDPLEGGPQNFPESDELWEWVKHNIYLRKTL
jgi:hypothetical protein